MTSPLIRHRIPTRAVATIATAALVLTLLGVVAPASTPPPADATETLPLAVDLLDAADPTRPRIVAQPAELPIIVDRADAGRDPYDTVLRRMQNRINAAPPPNAADQADCVQTPNVAREFIKMRAASNLSFFYLIDRTWDTDLRAARQPTPEERQAMGDRARDYLRFMCAESRTKVQVDRDINTSNELLSGLVAYDNLLAAGYEFGEHADVVLDNLVGTTAEFYSHYNQPNSPNFNILGASRFAVNNHRSKGAATIAIGAMVLHDLVPPVDPELDPNGWGDPHNWLDFGLERVDLVQRFTYGPGDGTYGEGPHYWRYAAINIVPMIRAWDRVADGATTATRDGIELPSLWRHPTFLLMQRWLLDMTLPDGSLAPLDDNKVDESGHFGNVPPEADDAGAFAWRWGQAPTPFDTDAAIDMGPWSMAIHDDSVPLAEPSGRPSAFYVEGGNAVFRSDWSEDARMVIVQGQHGAAREFGRNRDGVGEIWSAAHDHADPGAFLLHAYGERLLMDPGYMDYAWSMHRIMNKPSDHNMVLVGPPEDPQHPVDPLPASITTPQWGSVPGYPVPADGNAQISHTLDADHLGTARVTARYGEGASTGGGALVERRFLFLDDTYLVTADRATSDEVRAYNWPVHGQGGGTDGVMPAVPAKSPAQRPPAGIGGLPETPYEGSGGTFALTDAGAVWERPAARVSVGLAFDAGEPTVGHRDEFYEKRRNSLGQYTALYNEITADDVQGLTLNYPTPTGQAPPTIERVELDGAAALRLTDVDGDRR
ncbi:MAG: heparinase II/III family protein, partial [Acidimicrobiia bacterium]|nr:heparinase II/III family protein [Acidimicrobiia bacterium]